MPNHVPLKEIRFSASSRFFSNGTSRRPGEDRKTPWPENVTYFGEPSSEIDEAWAKLLNPIVMSLSKTEAKASWGERYLEYKSEEYGFTTV